MKNPINTNFFFYINILSSPSKCHSVALEVTEENLYKKKGKIKENFGPKSMTFP